MKSQQDPEDMLKQMAESLNLSVPEFAKMMEEEHELVPPDELDEDVPPPKRLMSIECRTPDEARQDAEKFRKQLLDPVLSKNEAITIANELAQCVSVYSDPQQRRTELDNGRPYETDVGHKAALRERNALTEIINDKILTAQYADKLSGSALAIAMMNGGKNSDKPIDLKELTQQVQMQMDHLRASQAGREEHLALLSILNQQAGQRILYESLLAPTSEAHAVMLKQAGGLFESSARIVEKLHNLGSPRPSPFYVTGDNHVIGQNQQIHADQPNQLLEKKNADRSNTRIMDTSKAASYEPVDAQKQAVDKKHRAKK